MPMLGRRPRTASAALADPVASFVAIAPEGYTLSSAR
jgi:hypothetical protein